MSLPRRPVPDLFKLLIWFSVVGCPFNELKVKLLAGSEGTSPFTQSHKANPPFDLLVSTSGSIFSQGLNRCTFVFARSFRQVSLGFWLRIDGPGCILVLII